MNGGCDINHISSTDVCHRCDAPVSNVQWLRRTEYDGQILGLELNLEASESTCRGIEAPLPEFCTMDI